MQALPSSYSVGLAIAFVFLLRGYPAVTLGFFEDVFLPFTSLREPRGYRADAQRWWWQFDEHKLEYGPLQRPIRFRVRDVRFVQTAANSLSSSCPTDKAGAGDWANPSLAADFDASRPMIVLGSVDEDGLGMKAWWQ